MISEEAEGKENKIYQDTCKSTATILEGPIFCVLIWLTHFSRKGSGRNSGGSDLMKQGDHLQSEGHFAGL